MDDYVIRDVSTATARSAKAVAWLLERSRSDRLRTLYWQLRARDVDIAYGDSRGDYPLVTSVISRSAATRVLDYGCGGGRLFQLYRDLHLREAVGFDIAPAMTAIARARYPDDQFGFVSGLPSDLIYTAGHFDLGIANRAISGVGPAHIDEVVATLCRLCRNVYVNEITDPDWQSSSYWFRHDYPALFSTHGFAVIERGVLQAEEWMSGEWYLFGPRTPRTAGDEHDQSGDSAGMGDSSVTSFLAQDHQTAAGNV